MKILAASDENGAGPFSALLRSISLSNAHLEPSIYLIDCGICTESREKLYNYSNHLGIELCITPIPDSYGSIRLDKMEEDHIPKAAFARIFADDVLPADVKRWLYLDIDTLVLKPLDDLWSLPLDDVIAAVVRQGKNDHLNDFGVSRDNYFGSGVMLINGDQWRRHKVSERCLKIIDDMPEVLRWKDQCALNLSLIGSVLFLGSEYNYIERPTDEVQSFVVPHILHFAGSSKPWITPHANPWGILYSRMSEKTPWPVDYHGEATRQSQRYREMSFVRRAIVRLGRKLSRI